MHRLEVGKPYGGPPRPEGVEFNFRAGECELIIVLRNPTIAETIDIQTGPARFGLYVEGDQILLCYKFGRMPWSDAPYHFGRLAAAGVPAEQQVLPPAPETLSPESRALLHTILLGAGGTVLVLRAVTLSPEFTRALFAAIRDQALRPYVATIYERELDALYQHYTSDQLAAACSVRCDGGA